MNVFVTGGTGFIGVPLVTALLARGDRVTVLTRNAARAKQVFGAAAVMFVEGDLETAGPWQAALAGNAAIVHLAGEPVAGKRWNARQKQVIRDSRVEATRALVEVIGGLPANQRPTALISASGIDYYPFAASGQDYDDDEVTEADPPADSFLARVCRDWEAEARAAEQHGVRVARMRIGAVLARDGGALAKIVPSFKAFAGGNIGSGRQWFSWIHRDDVIGAFVAATSDARYSGAFNLVAPQATRYADFAKALGKVLGRPSVFRVPGFVIKLAVGEMAEVVLHGRHVVPHALAQLGFQFRYTTIETALAETCG